MRTPGSLECSMLGRLGDQATRDCIPLSVTLELTLRCNIRCTHCYNFDRGVPLERQSAELSLEEIRPLLDDLRRAGTLFLPLTGGEAMVHPRFWEILDEAVARNFAPILLSNGTLLTPEACERLAGYPALWGVALSLYGARAETHDAVTRSPGSFQRTIEAARRLRELGTSVWLKYIVMKGNAGDVAAMNEWAAREGFDCSFDTNISGRYDGTLGSLTDRVDLPTLEALYKGPIRDLVGQRREDPSEEEFHCNCARGNAAVSSSGDVYPCIAAPVKAGNIREQGFLEIWKESPVLRWIRGLRLSELKTCAPCALKPWCRRSPGPAYVLHGDYTGVDPWTCGEAEILKKLGS